MKNFYHRAWAEINLDVLKNNIEIIRKYSGNRDIIAIVKANAYGHGDAECALAMNHIGVRHFAVSNLWEAQNLSSAGVEGDILIFGYCDILLIFENLDKNYIFTVGSVPYAEELSEAAVRAGVKVPVHIKFDRASLTGLITTYGNVEYDVAKTLLITDGTEVTAINSGDQMFTAEMVYRYIMFADFDEGESYRFNMIGSLLIELVNQNVSYIDGSLLNAYAECILNAETDLTSDQFDSRKAALLNTVKYGINPADYYVPYGEYGEDGSFTISDNSITTIQQKSGQSEE